MVLTAEDKMRKLLQMIGNASNCKGCSQMIFWVHSKAKNPMPLDPDGMPHFATCPKADRFRKQKPQANERTMQ